MKKWALGDKLPPTVSGPGLRTKLIILLILLMAFPLVVSSWLARESSESLGELVTKQTTSMTEEMRDSVATVGARTTTDAIRALEMLSREKMERLSTDLAREIAAFLYDRDDDLRLATGLDLTQESFRRFLEARTREVIDHGPWKLARDEKSWVPVNDEQPVPDQVGPLLRENQIGFHYRPPDTQDIKTRRPLYLEMTFVDNDGMEKLKVTTSSLLSDEHRDVSRRENTYCRAEDYFPRLKALGDDEIYVSEVIGPYVPSPIDGLYIPERAEWAAVPFEPELAGYAGKENPLGKRFQGLIRWACPVVRDGKRIGYITLALDHSHLMAFTDHLVPTEKRVSAISDASSGNYAFLADYEGKVIAHPRQYHIIGYDPRTGKRVPPWLDEETYAKWKKSGKDLYDFVKELPEYDNPSRYKNPSLEQVAAGQMGIDYRYLNFAPQCAGFQTLTKNGGSGSFHLFWSGLWKLNATAAIPYFTSRYGSQPRGFGHVGITANIEEFHSPALETKEFIDRFITERDSDLSYQQEALSQSISGSVAAGVRKLGQSTAIMLAIVIGLAASIASVLRNRVAAVTGGVRQFQDGNLHHRVDVRSGDELGQLATAFNQMAESIEASYVKLEESEQRFRAIFNQTFQLAAFLTPEGRVLAANEAMRKFVGGDDRELIGKPCWTLPWWASSPEHQSQVRLSVRRASRGELLRFEAASPDPQGGESFFDFSLKPFKDDSGEVVNLVLEAREITELKRAENELRKHRDQLELIVHERTRDLTTANQHLHREILDRKQAEYKVRAERDRAQRYLDIAGAIIVVIDAQQKTALINKKGCEVLGYQETELIGQDWFDTVLSREERERSRRVFAALVTRQNETVEYVESTVLTKDGRPLTIAWQNTVLADINGKPLGTLSSGVDITQRKKNEQELRLARDAAEVASRAKSTFLANMSHEIRTPLNAILGHCQLMVRDSSITQKQRESVETINRSGEHLLALINEVLEMSKIESGCAAFNPVDFDLHRLLEDLEMMFRARIETKGLQFEVSKSGDLPRRVLGDQSKIRQALTNLLDNAVKFTDRGGVVLRVFTKNGHGSEEDTDGGAARSNGSIQLALEVEDTGVGISDDDRASVFQPFEQFAAGKIADCGTGLGLAITKEHVGIMEGVISFTSKPGKGTVFCIVIPVLPGDEHVCDTGQSRRRVVALEPGQPDYRILVVDDIQTNRDILSTMLRGIGLDVRTADDGEQAVAVFAEWHPHAILMDMKMPVMDGRQATREIRSRPNGNRTVIVAVSAGVWEEERETILADGSDDFIRKPFRDEDVLRVLHHHLGVGYVYEQYDEEGRRMALSGENRGCAETLSFDAMPSDLVGELSDAAQSLDIDRLKGLLSRVAELNQVAAQAMSRLLRRYEFETLIEALEVRKDNL